MKNYLIDIDNEIKDYFNTSLNEKKLCENIIALLDYYTEPIIKSGINLTRKKLKLSNISNLNDENYKENVDKFKFEYLKELENMILASLSIKNTKDNFIDELIEIIIGICLGLFKWAQLYEYQINDINHIYINTDFNSCKLCQTKSKFKISIEEAILDIHPYCKTIFMPFNNHSILIDKVKQITSKLKMIIHEKYNHKEFILIDNLSENELFINNLFLNKEEDISIITKVKDKILSYEESNIVYINSETFSYLDYIIVSHCIDTTIINEEWWKNTFNEKLENKYIGENMVIYMNPFISYNCEQGYMSYYSESLIHYIIDSNKLKSIDEKAYNELKTNVFNNLEFTKGL